MIDMASRVENYFPERTGSGLPVLLIGPATDSPAPPLDLLKLSTFLRKRGYSPSLHRGVLDQTTPEPHAVILTSVFSWEVPGLRRLIAATRKHWPCARTILTGVLPRKLGEAVQRKFAVNIFDERSETLLDDERPDYGLVPEWDASIVITSKGVCPRECAHCETGARGKRVTKLIPKWHEHLQAQLPRIEVWDNTFALTSRDHFCDVAKRLGETGKPVDIVCGITPGGVDEAELHWRIDRLTPVQLAPARLECNSLEDLPRFFRLLRHARAAFGNNVRLRAFAVVNGTENPQTAQSRIDQMVAEGIEIDPICFTPDNWHGSQPYVNKATGWTLMDIERFRARD
jgi:hypothetical protein